MIQIPLKYNLFVLLILISVSCCCQIQKATNYAYCFGPGEPKSCLCASVYIFYDSIGFFHNGCEDHFRTISAFKYKVDSNSLECDFIPYTLFNPCKKIIRKRVDSLGDKIQVIVYEYSGRKVVPEIAVIKLRKKKDRIIRSYYNYKDTLLFEKNKRRRMVWTVEGLYPIFFAELRFNFQSPYNYYEIHMNLPWECFMKTEAKGWAEGIRKFKIINSTKFQDVRLSGEGYTTN